jgi:hypothetical protein
MTTLPHTDPEAGNPASEATKVKPEAVGEECWFAWVDALVDIWQDGNDNAPDERCYVPGALKNVMLEAKAALDAHRAALSSKAPVPQSEGPSEPVALTEAAVIAMMNALHSNVPEDERPMGRSDFSDEQWARAEAGARALLAASPKEQT